MSLWEKLVELDKHIFLFFNNLHTEWLDQPMFYISSDWFWIPLYLFFVLVLVRHFKKRAWLPIVAIVLTVAVSDQLSTLIKKTVGRPRPTHDQYIQNQVHTVNGYQGGSFGFVSSHAANTWGLSLFLICVLQLRLRYLFFLCAWASLVSYSRLYLGVHYPADLFFGGLLGIIVAFCVFLTYKKCEMSLFYRNRLP